MLGQFIAPDWRDASRYPDLKEATPSRWAWEFLRRNAGYQKAWAEYVTNVEDLAARHAVMPEWVAAFLLRNEEANAALRDKFTTDTLFDEYCSSSSAKICDDSDFREYDPRRNEEETEDEYHARMGRLGIEFRSTPLDHALGDKWGLKYIVSPVSILVGLGGASFVERQGTGVFYPNVDFREAMSALSPAGRYEVAYARIIRLSERLGKPELETVTFNLTMPIAPQLASAAKRLKSQQKIRLEKTAIQLVKTIKYQKQHYRNYLRAYDADAAGAEISEIVRLLRATAENSIATGSGASTTVRNWIRAAKALVVADYRSIPMAANAEKKREPKEKNRNQSVK